MALPINLVVRTRFNPNLRTEWSKSIMAVINNITLLVIVLTGAALGSANTEPWNICSSCRSDRPRS
jgi:hypothetical protein